jgi:hypothetical protein
MSASFGMESTFRELLAPGYFDIVNLTVNERRRPAKCALEARERIAAQVDAVVLDATVG